MPLSTSSVCFPVVRKHWLLYAWQLGKPDSAVKQQDLDGLRGWIRNAPQKAITAAQAQWRGLKEAQEGSIKNYVYKCALSQQELTAHYARRSTALTKSRISSQRGRCTPLAVLHSRCPQVHFTAKWPCAGSHRRSSRARTLQRPFSSSSLMRTSVLRFAWCTRCALCPNA